MKPGEIYDVVHKTVTKEAFKADCQVVEGHRRFAKNLPLPFLVSEEYATVLSAMVGHSPSNDWGLEGFSQTPLESGETLGQFVQENLPEFMQYVPKMESVANKYLRGV